MSNKKHSFDGLEEFGDDASDSFDDLIKQIKKLINLLYDSDISFDDLIKQIKKLIDSLDDASDSFDDLIKQIKKLINLLAEIKILDNPKIKDIDNCDNLIKIISEYIERCFNKILDKQETLNNEQIDEICDEYDRFGKQKNFLYTQLNIGVVKRSVDVLGLADKNQAAIEKKLNYIDNEIRKIFPQIITFLSLFVAVIALIVSNLTISLDNLSLKYILVTNLTFIFAIVLIFYIFCLLWSKDLSKIVRYVLFPIILASILIGLILVAILM